MRTLLKILSLFAAIAILTITIVILLLGTQSGTRWVVQTLSSNFPQHFTVQGIKGTLLSRLDLMGIEFRFDNKMLYSEHLVFHWQPFDLSQKKFSVRALELDDVVFQLPKDTDNKPITLPEFISIPLKIYVETASITDLTLMRANKQLLHFDQINLQANADNESLHITKAKAVSDDFEITLDGQSKLQHPYPIEGQVDWLARIPRISSKVKGKGSLSGNLHAIVLNNEIATPFGLNTRGTFFVFGGVPRFEISGHWVDLRWPLDKMSIYTSKEGQYEINGNIKKYNIAVNADLESARRVPKTFLKIKASGTTEGMRFDAIDAQTLEGIIFATGEIAWETGFSWDALITADHLNPGHHWPEWPGALNLSGHITGSVKNKRVELDLTQFKLKGHLRDQEIEAVGELARKDKRFITPGLELRSGDNYISIVGTAGSTYNFEYLIKAQNLAQLWPGLSGQLEGSGYVLGNIDAPLGEFSLMGNSIQYQDNSIAGFKIDGALATAPKQTSKIAINAQDINLGAIQVSAAEITAHGSPEHHQIQFTANADKLDTVINVSGRYQQKQWVAEVNKADMKSAILGLWRLNKPFGIDVTAKSVNVDTACWTSRPANACLYGAWHGKSGWNADANVTALPINRIKKWLPDNLRIEGLADINMEAEGIDSTEAQLTLKSKKGSIHYRTDTEKLKQSYRNALLTLDKAGDEIDSTFSMTFEQGFANGNMVFNTATKDLGGRANIDIPDISFLSPFVPDAQIKKGKFKLNGVLGGSSKSPTIAGNAQLLDGAIFLPKTAIEISNININAKNRESNNIIIDGSMNSGEGTVDLSGIVHLIQGKDLKYNLKVKGRQFNVADSPEVFAVANPDLKIRGQRNKVRISGKLDFPELRIKLEKLPKNIIKVSPDQIIVGGKNVDSKKRSTLAIFSDVEVVLGKNTSFEGFGLNTELSGNLRSHTSPLKGSSAEGELIALNGSYTAYGQELSIRHGELIFSGPVNNPALNIEAIREIEDDNVVAGLQITGTLQSPQTSLFSEPAFTEAEILAYILTGKPSFSSGQGAEANALAVAALAYGAKPLTDQLSQQLGLDLVVNSASTTEDTSLLVGRYLSPDLYVSYVYGLFDRLGTLQFTYSLSNRLKLKAETTNTEQAIDLNYTVEKD